jgi:hypothetical protein
VLNWFKIGPPLFLRDNYEAVINHHVCGIAASIIGSSDMLETIFALILQ